MRSTVMFFAHLPVGVALLRCWTGRTSSFVSNWGGRRPGLNDLIGPAGRGTTVQVNAVRRIPSEGTVSVVNLKFGLVGTEIVTGRRAWRWQFRQMKSTSSLANASDDNLSLIDIASLEVVETMWPSPGR